MNENLSGAGKVAKKKSGIVFLLIFLCLIILSAGIYFAYSNTNEKEDMKANDKKEMKEEEQEILETEKIVFSDCEESKCTYELLFGEENVNLIYEEINLDAEYELQYIIKLGDKVIFDDDEMLCGSPSAFQVLDQAVIISYHYGCDIGGNVVVAYNLEGEEIFSYQNLDEDYPEMYIDGSIENYFEIKDKVITLSAVRVTHGSSLLINESEYYMCNEEELAGIVTDNTVVAGIYEITYEGNGKFSKPKITKTTTFKEYMEANPCQ